MIRRIILFLSVAALMVTMVVAMAVPAFANHGEPHGFASPPDVTGDLPSGGDQGTENQGNGAVVTHCQANPGPDQGPGSSATVVGPSGESRGGGSC